MTVMNWKYPADPYAPPIAGVFHAQTPMEQSPEGQYTVYIPDSFAHCSPAVLIIPDNGVSAKGFFMNADGQAWKATADSNGIAIVIAEAWQCNTWNVTDAVDKRNDEEYLYNVVDTIRQKYSSLPAAFNLDERALYLVGYGVGGTAAHKMAMRWPQLFAGLISINGSDVPDAVISTYGNKLSYPFIAGQNSDGRETIGLRNNQIPLPVWMIYTDGVRGNAEHVKEHWIVAAKAEKEDANEFARTTYEKEAVRVWVSEGGQIPDTDILFEKFLGQVLRYTNKPGGKLEWRIDMESCDGKGFLFTEMEIDGKKRRWVTYVPKTYNENRAYPLIVAMHGGSNSAEAFAGDSRWHEAAEKYGFLVVFPQAYPCVSPLFGWIPVPVWNQYIIAPSDPPDDVAFIREVIVRTEQKYHVDKKKIFATGHSNGAGMAWRLGLDAPELFAGIAPAGWTVSAVPGENSVPDTETPLPVWVFMGRYDQVGADTFKRGNANDVCLKYWASRNGFDPSKMKTEYDDSGSYYTRIWTNEKDDIPLFKYTSIADCPHIYVPYECELLWEQFFSKLSLEESGKRYFEGKMIQKGQEAHVI